MIDVLGARAMAACSSEPIIVGRFLRDGSINVSPSKPKGGAADLRMSPADPVTSEPGTGVGELACGVSV